MQTDGYGGDATAIACDADFVIRSQVSVEVGPRVCHHSQRVRHQPKCVLEPAIKLQYLFLCALRSLDGDPAAVQSKVERQGPMDAYEDESEQWSRARHHDILPVKRLKDSMRIERKYVVKEVAPSVHISIRVVQSCCEVKCCCRCPKQ